MDKSVFKMFLLKKLTRGLCPEDLNKELDSYLAKDLCDCINQLKNFLKYKLCTGLTK